MAESSPRQGSSNLFLVIGCVFALLIPVGGFSGARVALRSELIGDAWASIIFWASVGVGVMVLPTCLCLRLWRRPWSEQALAWLAWLVCLVVVSGLVYLRLVVEALMSW